MEYSEILSFLIHQHEKNFASLTKILATENGTFSFIEKEVSPYEYCLSIANTRYIVQFSVRVTKNIGVYKTYRLDEGSEYGKYIKTHIPELDITLSGENASSAFDKPQQILRMDGSGQTRAITNLENFGRNYLSVFIQFT